MKTKRVGHLLHNVSDHIGPNPLQEVVDGITAEDSLRAIKAESELCSKINLGFSSDRKLPGLESTEFCLVFDPCMDWLLPVLNQSTYSVEVQPPEIVPNGMDVVVFVPIGKRTKKGQIVWVGKIPYLVRLASVNESDGVNRHATSHPLPLRERTLRRFGVFTEDRKCGLEAGRIPVAEDKLTGQMIQGGSQVMSDISDDNSDLCRGLLQYAYTNYLVSFLDIWINEKAIGIRVKEGLDKSVKLVSMRKRPLYLEAYSAEIKHGVMPLETQFTRTTEGLSPSSLGSPL